MSADENESRPGEKADPPDRLEICVVEIWFPIGQVVATPAALGALEEAGQAVETFLTRHCVCDWGELDADDTALNNAAVEGGGRLLSAYSLSTGQKLWIITEADRSATTLLLPDITDCRLANNTLRHFRQPATFRRLSSLVVGLPVA